MKEIFFSLKALRDCQRGSGKNKTEMPYIDIYNQLNYLFHVSVCNKKEKKTQKAYPINTFLKKLLKEEI